VGGRRCKALRLLKMIKALKVLKYTHYGFAHLRRSGAANVGRWERANVGKGGAQRRELVNRTP
jgi:hypothetical protein